MGAESEVLMLQDWLTQFLTGRRQRDDTTKLRYDLAVVEAMAAELEPYLKSDTLYWQLSPARAIVPAAPLLTIGGLVLRLHRLAGQKEALTTEQLVRLAAAEESFRRALSEWKAHAAARMIRELDARLKSWSWFVEDCRAQKRSCISHYPTEAELRTLIELLLEEATGCEDVSDQRHRLAQLDADFRQWFEPGDFVWRPALAPVYSRQRFWWLYGRPEFRQQD
jgi:hypothetical protein